MFISVILAKSYLALVGLWYPTKALHLHEQKTEWPSQSLSPAPSVVSGRKICWRRHWKLLLLSVVSYMTLVQGMCRTNVASRNNYHKPR